MNHQVKQFFEGEVESYSANYLGKRTGTNLLFRTRLLLACELARGARGALLDCAAGSGEITAGVLASGAFQSATVVDISANMLARARVLLEKRPKIALDFVNADVFEFLQAANPEKQFDLMLCLGLIAHTGRLDVVLRKLRDRLTPNGRILLQSTLLDHLGTRIVRALTQRRYTRRKGYKISYYTVGEIVSTAGSVGLQVVSARRYTLGIPFGDKIWPLGNYCLERLSQRWAETHGSEAMLVIQKKSPSP